MTTFADKYRRTTTTSFADTYRKDKSGVSRRQNPDIQPTSYKPSFEMRNFPGTIQKLSEIQTDPFNLKSNKAFLPEYLKGIKEGVVGAGESLRRTLGLEGKQTKTQKIGSVLETGVRTVGAVISPITSAFSAAETLPGWGTVAKLINSTFSFAGELGSGPIGAGIDWAVKPLIDSKNPKLVEVGNKIKTDIKPAIQEITALVSQITLGKAVDLGVKRAELTRKYGATDANTIITKAQEIVDQKKITKPFAEQYRKQPVQPTEFNPMEPVGTMEVSSTKLSSRVNEIAKRLEADLGELEPTKSTNWIEQAKIVEDVFRRDPGLAKRIALSQEPPPKGALAGSFYSELTNKAQLEGDIGTLYDLTRSSATGQYRAFGQEIQALSRINSENPVSMAKDIIKARTPKDAPIKIEKEVQQFKTEIKKARATKETLSNFLDSLIC